jgi:hypothetical protein
LYSDGGGTRHGIACALLGIKNNNTGSIDNTIVDDTVTEIKSNRYIFRYISAQSSLFETADHPIDFMCMYDISRDHDATADIDSVCNDMVSDDNAITSYLTGTKDTDDPGDVTGASGFSHADGAWVISSNGNNTVHFKINGLDTARFYPAFKITDYTSARPPQYVFSDSVPQLRDYGYTAYLDKNAHALYIQMNHVYDTVAEIWISAEVTLAVTVSDFFATPGDGCDTLHWRTESEHENAGFVLHRRIKPGFIDSVCCTPDSVQKPDSVYAKAARLYKRGAISAADTVWKRVNDELIPGAQGGKSEGTREYMLTDRDVINNVKYEYKLVSVDFDNKQSTHDERAVVMPRVQLPTRFMLGRNYPNPFHRVTRIRFALKRRSPVTLDIYTMQGRLVKRIIGPDEVMQRAVHEVLWDGRDKNGMPVSSGPYVYRIRAGSFRKAKKLLVVR